MRLLDGVKGCQTFKGVLVARGMDELDDLGTRSR
jgi:hypothetical protein